MSDLRFSLTKLLEGIAKYEESLRCSKCKKIVENLEYHQQHGVFTCRQCCRGEVVDRNNNNTVSVKELLETNAERIGGPPTTTAKKKKQKQDPFRLLKILHQVLDHHYHEPHENNTAVQSLPVVSQPVVSSTTTTTKDKNKDNDNDDDDFRFVARNDQGGMVYYGGDLSEKCYSSGRIGRQRFERLEQKRDALVVRHNDDDDDDDDEDFEFHSQASMPTPKNKTHQTTRKKPPVLKIQVGSNNNNNNNNNKTQQQRPSTDKSPSRHFPFPSPSSNRKRPRLEGVQEGTEPSSPFRKRNRRKTTTTTTQTTHGMKPNLDGTNDNARSEEEVGDRGATTQTQSKAEGTNNRARSDAAIDPQPYQHQQQKKEEEEEEEEEVGDRDAMSSSLSLSQQTQFTKLDSQLPQTEEFRDLMMRTNSTDYTAAALPTTQEFQRLLLRNSKAAKPLEPVVRISQMSQDTATTDSHDTSAAVTTTQTQHGVGPVVTFDTLEKDFVAYVPTFVDITRSQVVKSLSFGKETMANNHYVTRPVHKIGLFGGTKSYSYIRTCCRTFEFLKAQALGINVVSTDWVREIAETGSGLSPTNFGIWGDLQVYETAHAVRHGNKGHDWLKRADWWDTDSGPCTSAQRHALRVKQGHEPPMLHKHCIMLWEGTNNNNNNNNSPTITQSSIHNRPIHLLKHEEVQLLCRLWGATMVDDLHQWPSDNGQCIVLVPDLVSKEALRGDFPFKSRAKESIAWVRYSWLVESICANVVAPIEPFVLK